MLQAKTHALQQILDTCTATDFGHMHCSRFWTHALQQILDLGRYDVLPMAPMAMILVVLKSWYRELSKNVYFYALLASSF